MCCPVFTPVCRRHGHFVFHQLVELPKIFCIDFEDQYQLADSGVYVFNDGVKRVNNALCPNAGIAGSSYCGHFLGSNSRLEVPFFSNNYDHFGSLRITMLYRRMGANAAEQGILSNDCSGGIAGQAGNSLFCSVDKGLFYAGVRRNQPPAAFAQIITDDVSASKQEDEIQIIMCSSVSDGIGSICARLLRHYRGLNGFREFLNYSVITTLFIYILYY